MTYGEAEARDDIQRVRNVCESHDTRHIRHTGSMPMTAAADRLAVYVARLEVSDRICRAMRTEAKTDGVAKGPRA